MTMYKLVIGEDEYFLAEDLDIPTLQARIAAVVQGGGGFVTIETNGGRPVSDVFFSPGLNFRIEKITPIKALYED